MAANAYPPELRGSQPMTPPVTPSFSKVALSNRQDKLAMEMGNLGLQGGQKNAPFVRQQYPRRARERGPYNPTLPYAHPSIPHPLPPPPSPPPPPTMLQPQLNHHPASGPARSRSIGTASLAPRSFEELHVERSYLLHNLQRQDDRARRLLYTLAAAEERVVAAEARRDAKEARRGRKAIALVRSRIAESAQQEKLILLRLGDLYVEIQSRERWCQVQQQRAAGPFQQLPPLSTGHGFGQPLSPMSPLLWSPITPLFDSGMFFFSEPLEQTIEEDEDPIQGEAELQGQDGRQTSSLSKDEPRESLEYEYVGVKEEEAEGGAEQQQQQKVCSTPAPEDSPSASRREKRLSLPTLHFIWPGTEA